MTQGAPSLRREILIWYSLVLVVALSIFATAAYFLLQRAVESSEEQSLRQTAGAVEQFAIPPRIPRIETSEEFATFENDMGEEVRALRRRIVLATGQAVDVVVAPPGDVAARTLSSFLIISLILIPLTAALAALGAGALLERLLAPLRRLVEETRAIGIAGLSRRVPEPERPSDLQDLAQSFNDMLMRLERAVDALRHFTADASHELRTPLTSIQGNVQVALSRPRSAEELKETLADVMEETEWMLHLVDGLLTLARGEEGPTALKREIVEVGQLLEDGAEMGRLLALEKPIDIELDIESPLYMDGSGGQLRQVFVNLISNAVKFTWEGKVQIEAHRVPAGPKEGWIDIRIRDTGVGISDEEQPRVFDRFYRGDRARAREGGTGLGLAIAKLLVQQHGGSIELQSEPGVGSEFRVMLPSRSPVVVEQRLATGQSAQSS